MRRPGEAVSVRAGHPVFRRGPRASAVARRTAAVLSAMIYVQMTARRPDEAHRTATPLELFFDLCFVVAVAQAGARLVHALAEGHVGAGITGYLFVFFGVFWAWMNGATG